MVGTAFADILVRHAHSLLTIQSVLPWGHQPHPLVGASCLLFSAPALVDRRLWWRWPAQALTSFMSDHVYCGLPSMWHVADRWCATANVLMEVLRAARCLPPWLVLLLAALPLSCKAAGSIASKRANLRAYRVTHVLWHTLASLVSLFVEHAYHLHL